QQALAAARRLDDKHLMATTLMNIGNVHANAGRDTQALECLFESLSIVEEHVAHERSLFASLLMNIAAVFHRMGDYSLALDYYLRSLALREELKQRGDIATSMMNIGLV